MTAPDDMPDHIWAQTHTGTDRQGRWSVVDLNVYAPASKYVRADLVDELVRALEVISDMETAYANATVRRRALSARAALNRYRGDTK